MATLGAVTNPIAAGYSPPLPTTVRTDASKGDDTPAPTTTKPAPVAQDAAAPVGGVYNAVASVNASTVRGAALDLSA